MNNDTYTPTYAELSWLRRELVAVARTNPRQWARANCLLPWPVHRAVALLPWVSLQPGTRQAEWFGTN